VTPLPIPVIRAYGTHTEAGRLVGEETSAVIRRSVSSTHADPALVERYRAVTLEHLPWIVDELDGVAEGAGVEPLGVFAASIEELAAAAAPTGCSDLVVTGARTADGHVLVAHTNDLYAEDEYGSHILHSLERAHRFNRWMADAVAPHVGARVLEIGAGIGNITNWLLPRDFYVSSDINPHYLDYLRNMALGKPYLDVARLDLESSQDFEPWRGRFDTVVCLNVLEHVGDPLTSLKNIHSALAPGGRAVIYVPQGQGLYSSLDEVLGHRCRYSQSALTQELESAGFVVESVRDFNRFGVPGWWLNGKVLKRRSFSRVQLKIFDWLTPLFRLIDPLVPTRGLGIIAVARRP